MRGRKQGTPQRNWSKEEIDLLLRLWPDPEQSLETIATEIGRRASAVNAKRRALKLPGRKQISGGPRKPTTEEAEAFKALYAQGVSMLDISADLSVGHDTVRRWRKELGLPLRDNGFQSTGQWDGAAKARLAELWGENLSGQQIAEVMSREFSRNYTKNAVTGQAHRMKLPQRESPIKRGVTPKRKRRDTSKVRQALKTENCASEPAVRFGTWSMAGGGRFASQSGYKTCQWLHGCPKDRHFCGKPTVGGSSWCEEHYRIVFPPSDEKHKGWRAAA